MCLNKFLAGEKTNVRVILRVWVSSYLIALGWDAGSNTVR